MEIDILCDVHGESTGGVACSHVVDFKAQEVFITADRNAFCEACHDKRDVLHIESLLPVCEACMRYVVNRYVEEGKSVNGIGYLFSLH